MTGNLFLAGALFLALCGQRVDGEMEAIREPDVVIRSVTFDPCSMEISRLQRGSIIQNAEAVRRNQDLTLEAFGFVSGDERCPGVSDLARKRAEAVIAALIELGVSQDRLWISSAASRGGRIVWFHPHSRRQRWIEGVIRSVGTDGLVNVLVTVEHKNGRTSVFSARDDGWYFYPIASEGVYRITVKAEGHPSQQADVRVEGPLGQGERHDFVFP